MHYYEVAVLRAVYANTGTLTYHSTIKLTIGNIVLVPIGRKNVYGIIIKSVKKPIFDTKQIIDLLMESTLPQQLVSTMTWISEYYNTPIGMVANTLVPKGLSTKRRLKKHPVNIPTRKRTKYLLNTEQQKAVKSLIIGNGSFILQGITGSGKTAVYIETAKYFYSMGRSSIIILPEIALTSQIIAEFKNHFDSVITIHSKLTESNRHTIWLDLMNDKNTPHIIIGARSALFAPLKNVGLIVIDESHEPSLKQDQSPKYNALRVASVLGRYHNAVVVFGSATPSISEKYFISKAGRPTLYLQNKAIKKAQKPNIKIVDMRQYSARSKHYLFSDELLDEISNSMINNHQTLIYHNRRGTHNLAICKSCGWQALCHDCLIPFTLHNDIGSLICHTCGAKHKIPTSCPKCSSTDVIYKGAGTKLIEQELNKLFPKSNIARFDSDNVGEETLASRYQDIYNAKINIIVGTQVIAKGLDLPNLRTIGVVQADTGLCLPDYTSNERSFQLLMQVIGRVGRTANSSNIVIQTYNPEHPSIIYGSNQDYEGFYEYELINRKKSNFPPYCFLMQLKCTYSKESYAISSSRKLASSIRQIFPDVQIVGPAPAFYEHRGGRYIWQLVIKSKKRQTLQQIIEIVPKNNWQFDIDPSSLL